VFFDESLLKSGIGLALAAPLGELSYHLTIGNLEHASIQHLSHGILYPPCFYIMHSSISIGKGFGPNMVALQ